MGNKKRVWRRIIVNSSDSDEDDLTNTDVTTNGLVSAVSIDASDNLVPVCKTSKRDSHGLLAGNISSDCGDHDMPVCKKAKYSNSFECTTVQTLQINCHAKSASREHAEAFNAVNAFDADCSRSLGEIPLQRPWKTCVTIQVPSTTISSIYQQACTHLRTSVIPETAFHKGPVNKLLCEQEKHPLDLTSNMSVEKRQYMLQALIKLIFNFIVQNQQKMTRLSEIKYLINNGGLGVWASWMMILNLQFFDSSNILFLEALKSVLQFCQSQVTVIKLISVYITEMNLQQSCFKSDVMIMQENLVSLALSIYKLLKKTEIWMDDFFGLLVDITLLPTFGEGATKTQMRCLNLVTSVTKGHNALREICISKVYSSMSRQCTGNEFSVPLESGERVSKFTLVLLSVIQSTVQFSASREDPKDFILCRRLQDVAVFLTDVRDHFNRRIADKMLLNNADYFLAHFWVRLRESLLQDEAIPENFGRVIRDLGALTAQPKWPAAEYALFTFCGYAEFVLVILMYLYRYGRSLTKARPYQ